METAVTPQRVLVTGSAGNIGTIVTTALRRRGHVVRGFDRRPTPDLADAVLGDLTDPAAVARAMQGMECVVHLAAFANEADFMTVLLPANVIGLYHVCDQARQAGVKKLILASSVQAVGGHDCRQKLVRVEDGTAPTNHYALTKVWAEEMGRMYALKHGLSVLAVRIGWVKLRAPEPANAGLIMRLIYLSRRDCASFFTCAVEAPLAAGQFAVVFASSRHGETAGMDPEPARRLLGYEAQDEYPGGWEYP